MIAIEAVFMNQKVLISIISAVEAYKNGKP